MPIYEFVCESCGRLVEKLQKVSDPPPDACPECGGMMAKIMSRNSFQLKGGGWYRDLYSSSPGKKEAPGAATGTGGDGKPRESKPGESKPAEGKPAEAKPVEAKQIGRAHV